MNKTKYRHRFTTEDHSDAIFQQDGAPAHNAKITQDWLGGRINKFWVKGTWPANSQT